MTKEQRQYNGAKVVFSTNGAGTSIHMTKRKMNPDTDLIFFTKINSKWTIDHKCRSIKLLDNNIGENLNDLEYGDDFLGTVSKA